MSLLQKIYNDNNKIIIWPVDDDDGDEQGSHSGRREFN